jgi:hypothetical protein
VLPSAGEVEIPLYGEARGGRFVVDRGSRQGRERLPSALRPVGEAFAVRNWSGRISMLRSATLFCDTGPVVLGNVVLVVRTDKTADVAVVVPHGMGFGLQMYSPTETVDADGADIEGMFRVLEVRFAVGD